jgi:hypothetical protein
MKFLYSYTWGHHMTWTMGAPYDMDHGSAVHVRNCWCLFPAPYIIALGILSITSVPLSMLLSTNTRSSLSLPPFGHVSLFS